jgi:tRNA pseudouridine38-40 synthase
MEPASTCIKAVVRYEGGGFAGWQVQPGLRTVQGALEDALGRIAGEPVAVVGAGRTDAGVHALGQVASFRWPGDDLPALRRSLCAMLGPEVRVESLVAAPAGFDARRSARGKRYSYTLALGRYPDPFLARYAWNPPGKVDMDRIAALARRVEGRHDFAGYQGGKAGSRTTVRTVHRIGVAPGGWMAPMDARDTWRLDFYGDAFLYKMVRNLVGTLVEVARGQEPEAALERRLGESGPYRGFTAPAHGLALVDVEYGPAGAAGPTEKEPG